VLFSWCPFIVRIYVIKLWIFFAVKKPEKELLEVLELPDCGPTQTTRSRSSPLDSVLKAFSSSTTTPSSRLTNTAAVKDGTAEPLSSEASAVLSRLPDLSFMHSKVLMFPVSDYANWANVHCSAVIVSLSTRHNLLRQVLKL